MKIVRFKNQDYVGFGKCDQYHITPFLKGKDPYNTSLSDDSFEKSIKFELKECAFLPPVKPSKIIGVALNYPGVSENIDKENPLIFLKSSNTITTSNSVVLPKNLKAWGEGELGVIIKKQAKEIDAKDAEDFILGFTVVNDVTCNNFQGRDHHLARSKSQDGFCPISNYIETDYDYTGKVIEAYQNDELIRKGNTSDMVFDIPSIIEYVTSFMTLFPEDIIITGAPPRVREKIYLQTNDTYRISIDGLEEIETKFL